MTHLMPQRRGRMALAGAAALLVSLVLATSAMADQPTSVGTFVIGDQNALTPGSQVTFWGAQWWIDNPLSTGFAPAAFKGFAETTNPNCGQSWTSEPGNSSHPPAMIGPIIRVIVASNITQSGSVITGDTTEVVDVAVDPGYAGDPGHPGTGTVTYVECGGYLPPAG